MKFNKLSALCALACAAVSGQAFAAMTAAEQAIINDANANNRVVFISGASAVQKGFTAIANSLFQSGSVRFADTTASSKNFEAVAGKLSAAAGSWAAGTNVVVIYRVKGGSVFGVDPVARATAIESLNVTSAACGASGAGTSATPYVCSTSLASRVPDAGVSDVAPALFDAAYNTEGETAAAALSADELALLTPTPVYGLAFGLPVTKNVGMIDLNKSVISAIMSGNVGTWDAVDASQTGDILVCRRTPGSGTQAVSNLYYGNYPCDTSGSVSNAPADRDASAAWDNTSNTYNVTAGTGGLVVIENSTSGDVRKCLDAAVVGGTYTTSDRDGVPVTVNMGSGGHKAVGVLSMDGLSSSKSVGNWQFRSLDGAGTYTWDNTAVAPVATGTGKFPTLANLVNGTWDEQGWVSINVPERTTGNKAAFVTNFINKAQDPAVLASISDLKNVAAAIPGGSYSGAQVLRAAYVGGNQCAPLNRNY
jgi:hypothetical protein